MVITLGSQRCDSELGLKSDRIYSSNVSQISIGDGSLYHRMVHQADYLISMLFHYISVGGFATALSNENQYSYLNTKSIYFNLFQ